jgi:CRISPR system Cascade subunit CasE
VILSRLTIDLRHPRARRDARDCHALHQTLLGCIGARRADGQVLHRREGDRLLVQSRAIPDWSRLPAGYVRGAVALERMRLDWPAGAELGFVLRACPVKAAVERPGERGVRRALRGEEERLAWIRRRLAAAGAEVVEVEIGGDMPTHGQHGPDRIVLPAVAFRGRLRVVEPDALAAALVAGIGPGKAYGCGLLTVVEE